MDIKYIKKEVEDETLDYSIVKEEYRITEDASVSVKEIGDVLTVKEEVKSEFIEIEPSLYPTLATNTLPSHVEDETLNSFIVKEEYCIIEDATVSVKKIGDNADNAELKKQDFPIMRTNQLRKSPPPLIYFTPPSCNKSFETHSLLNQHSETHMVDVTIPSSTCQKHLETATSLRKRDIKKLHVCEICGMKFLYRYHMYLHIRRVHESNNEAVNIPKIIECPVPNCFQKFTYLHYLKLHMIVHRAETPFECPKCPRKFKTKHVLVGHLRFHENETILLTCAICNKKFQWKKDIRKHMLEHTIRKRNVTCPHCSQNISKDYLETHIKKQHKGLPLIEEKEKHISIRSSLSGKRLQCSQCEKSYEASSSLKRHMQLHIGGVSIRCPICKNSFKTAGYLRRHMKKIHGVKPFQCQQCYKLYVTTTALKLHMKKHKEYERTSFICLICDQSFKSTCSLKNHMRIHGERRHEFKICEELPAEI